MAWATTCSMLAGVKVEMPGGTLVILMVRAFSEKTILRLDSLGISGSEHLMLALASCVVGLAGVKVNCYSNKGDV